MAPTAPAMFFFAPPKFAKNFAKFVKIRQYFMLVMIRLILLLKSGTWELFLIIQLVWMLILIKFVRLLSIIFIIFVEFQNTFLKNA